ncbi:MAG: hypothetical protein DCF15_19840 [Phormidesmis priestleyi]|uniref:Uncharacterized protein n=1 Tax=Phormidesmis priestleyi TaxID=268141 RepID=A0A2W4WNX1_9CYAN|nr:MAG: hypothetical protein DCF15_19840 [Phormidesmis priestleyi]
MFAKDGLVYWRQHIFWEGTKFPSYSFALLFSQLLAIYDIEVPCHPVRLVTRPEVTEKAVLDTAIEELELSDDVRLLGAVINAARVKSNDDAYITQESELEAAELPREPEFSAPAGRIDF